ncbi:virulence-associated E family protein [Calothrix sp. NIES-4101]|nr:virulence-associated E family protein [Calothrix sp. NIES-4101]
MDTCTKKRDVDAPQSNNNTLNKILGSQATSEDNFNTEIPISVDSKHWNEWLNSGVEPSIITNNIRSIFESYEVDKILNRTKRRWKDTNKITPCWLVSGIDPLTDEPTLLGCQVKPDVPLVGKNGKTQKYIGANEHDTAPLFLKTGIDNYWVSIINDKSIPVIITEGGKKAGAGLTIGHPTISIPGVSTCRKNGKLHDYLQLFVGFGRIFYLCFDNDVSYKRPVQNAMIGLARELSASGSKVMVINLPPGDAKGMDDYISQNGKEAFDKLIEDAETIEEWRKRIEEQWQEQLLAEQEENPSRLARRFEIVKQGWGESLALNILKSSVELNGMPLDMDQIRLYLSLEFKEDIPIGDAKAIIDMLAGQNAYNPVAQYLDGLHEQYPDPDTSILDNLATRYFGTDDPLHNIYMKKHLVASVARIRKPGCKHDCATILVGNQGVGKSTFWETLHGREWFSDELGDANEKDELAKLHRFWCLEWSEFETVYRRKDVGALKKFMTATVDTYRAPYSIHPKDYPRMSVLVGTTNETEILSDPTGNRRFWIIPSKRDSIPTDLLAQERDRIWAAANHLYFAGYKWWLTPEERERQDTLNQNYQVKDPWEEKVKEYIRGRDYVTVDAVLTALDVEVSRQDVRMAHRVGNTLRRLGWKQSRKRIGDGVIRVWIPEDELSDYPSDDVSFVKTENFDQKNQKKNSLGNYSGSSGSSGSALENVSQNPNFTTGNETNQYVLVDQGLTPTVQGIQPTEKNSDPLDPLEMTKLFFSSENTSVGSDPSLTPHNEKPCTEIKSLPDSSKAIYHSPLGQIKAIAEPITDKQWKFTLMLADSMEVVHSQEMSANAKKAAQKLKRVKDNWIESLVFRVHRIEGMEYQWIENCKCVETRSHYDPNRTVFVFQCPDGKLISKQMRENDEFELVNG